ncbi:glycosyl transferase [Romboutsia lituseburensis]|uniref:UDP-N-acetylmuramyl pentapeptide phosphotransferase/UDP-N-acetylglucosamine-1-phosphate transferase n=1 Tax=Romboutsia lituseburensis DSM 797 TaxID=1121325 RepID=A0A1G9Q9L7_9FIRM|nr:glycosyl transferase [Romboutsia lituseburensis]CEH35382.1 Glycosyl transferase 4 [Romboutsia lituseburensis]SDM07035.1 UDP-N-acetylmuramyl pentapeptide phosphotransferase/UDP-N-acetylglucosamine-1-phosphate transferase [Romboutsia lituseburensis DSM 797]
MQSYILDIILLLTGLLGTYAIIPLFKNLLIESNVLRPNYKKDMIPVSMGIVFLPMIIINGIILAFFTKEDKNLLYLFMFIFGLISMFFAGVLDDIIGNRDVSGLKGHFKSLLKGSLTTGGFKALFGGFVGIIISIAVSKNIGDIIINTLIIALSTNLMNLLDLRPGRAIKVYLTISTVLFLTLTGYVKSLILLIVPNVLAYFNYDLKARAMMGDTGSNVLGISIGMLVIMGYSMKVRIGWLVFLVLIHILTEKYSLTKIIEKNKFLNFIDKLGR